MMPVLDFSLYGQALLWSFLIVTIGPLGSNVAIQTRAVSYLKQGNVARLAYLCGQSLSATLIISCLALFLVGGFHLLDYLAFERLVSAALGIVLGVTQSLFLLKTTVIRCNFDFQKYARLCALRALLIFIFYLGIIGVVSEFKIFIIIDIGVTLLLIVPAKLPIPFGINFKPIWRFSIISHIYKNTSLILFVFSSFMLVSFERIVGYFSLDDSQYVVIAFAAVFFSVSTNIQSIANSYIFPMMAKCFDEKGEIALIQQGALYTVASAVILGLFGAMFAIACVPVAMVFFENMPLTENLILFIALLSVLRVTDFFTNVFLLLNKEKTLIYVRLIACIAAFAYISVYREPVDLIFAALVGTSTIYVLGITVLLFRLTLIVKKD